jgi:tRNA (adenine22-N1)-methyltransferase
MKLTKRLALLASFVPQKKIVYDIGCDHALLDIYLTQYNDKLCYSCDINENALKSAKKNIQKYHLEEKIQTIISDGFENIEVQKNSIAIISGMGTSTILKILNHPQIEKLDSIILQTNNDYATLRKSISKMNYKITDERTIFEKDIYYIMMKIEKGKSHYSKYDLEFGPFLRKSKEIEVFFLYQHLYETKSEILKKLPRGYLGKKMKLMCEISWLRRKLKNWES